MFKYFHNLNDNINQKHYFLIPVNLAKSTATARATAASTVTTKTAAAKYHENMQINIKKTSRKIF